jgi:L-amino acid N-acyltransferase YncA
VRRNHAGDAPDTMGLRTRPATIADAAAIVVIYNHGIADRIATFETEPRAAIDIVEWFTGQHLVVVAETGEAGPVAFAASFPYINRPCYRGIGEFYVRRDYRGRGAGSTVLAALINAATAAGLHKLTSRVFSGERGQPRPSERPRFRGNRDSSAAWAIGWPLA